MTYNVYLPAGVLTLQYRCDMVKLGADAFFQSGFSRVKKYFIRKGYRNCSILRVECDIVAFSKTAGLSRGLLAFGNLSLELFYCLPVLVNLLRRLAFLC